MPALRQTSSTVVPSSVCFSMKAICCSLNLDFFTPRISWRTMAKPNRGILTKIGPVCGLRSISMVCRRALQL